MKNYHHALLTILLFLVVGNLAAQRSIEGIVKGKVSDQSTGQPLFFATISIFNAADSSLVTGGTTDEQGVFSIEINSGVYYADITFISYQNKIINDIRIAAPMKQYIF